MIIGNSYTQIRARAPALQVPRESKSRHGQFQVVENPRILEVDFYSELFS